MSGCGESWCHVPDTFNVDTDGTVDHTHRSVRVGTDRTQVWIQGDFKAGPRGVAVHGPGLVIDRPEAWGSAQAEVIPLDDALELVRDMAELAERLRAGSIEHLVEQLRMLQQLLTEGHVSA